LAAEPEKIIIIIIMIIIIIRLSISGYLAYKKTRNCTNVTLLNLMRKPLYFRHKWGKIREYGTDYFEGVRKLD
jgi:hypothetical protein